MRVHSNGIVLRTTNKKVLVKFKNGTTREWYFDKYQDKQDLIAEIADTTYQIAENHEKGKFNIVLFSIALTKLFKKLDPSFQAKIATLPERQSFYWLNYISFLPFSKTAPSFSPLQLKELDDLTKFFTNHSF